MLAGEGPGLGISYLQWGSGASPLVLRDRAYWLQLSRLVRKTFEGLVCLFGNFLHCACCGEWGGYEDGWRGVDQA